jgi:hypothetical protein
LRIVVHIGWVLSQQAPRIRINGLKSVGSERATSPSPPAGDDGVARAKTEIRPLGGTVTVTLGPPRSTKALDCVVTSPGFSSNATV